MTSVELEINHQYFTRIFKTTIIFHTSLKGGTYVIIWLGESPLCGRRPQNRLLL